MDDTDALDLLVEAEAAPVAGQRALLVVPRKAADSAEHEEMEKAFFNGPIGTGPKWPTPFFNAGELVPANELRKDELAGLAELGLTESEWRQLESRTRPIEI